MPSFNVAHCITWQKHCVRMSIIPPETIRVFSERTLGPGFTLDDEVAQAVARELEYKIREITQVYRCVGI